MFVGSTTAEVATDAEAYLFKGRNGVGSEESLSRHDLTGGTVTTLKRIVLQECLLYWTEFLASH